MTPQPVPKHLLQETFDDINAAEHLTRLVVDDDEAASPELKTAALRALSRLLNGTYDRLEPYMITDHGAGG